MKTRNADNPKTPASVKKTPPARNSASKTPPNPPELVTPKTVETKRVSAAKARQLKKKESPSTPVVNQQSAAEAGASGGGVQVKSGKKVTAATKSAAKRATGKSKTPISAKVLAAQTTEYVKPVQERIEEAKNEDVTDCKDTETVNAEPLVENVGEVCEKERTIMEVEQPSSGNSGSSQKDDAVKVETIPTVNMESSSEQEKPMAEETENTSENEKSSGAMETDDVEEEPEEEEDPNDVDDRENAELQPVYMGKNLEEELEDASKPVNQELDISQGMEEQTDKVERVEQEKNLVEDDPEEPAEETGTLDEGCGELSAIAKERRIKKELEIFVGGLDRDSVEEDLKKVFEKIGEVVEVRMHKNPSGKKNKGYAFVRFASKELAKRALAEMKNPMIRGKRCGTAPSEDNDMLFVGNICNTWTKDAIKKRLKDYDIEGVVNITLVPDLRHEGLSRGFAFVEFSCHADAMLAYKRLQKPDVIFGHTERTVKVAFAEPLSQPDPEVMAQVKSVFVDGVPPDWTEELIGEKFKDYGEVERVVLSRNIARAKRKDFGFVDFSTHEAAVACINGVNNSEVGKGVSKTKVKARLLNPMPKTQAVKGEMSGGYKIGPNGRGLSRSGKGSGQASGKASTHSHRSHVLHHPGWGQSGRVGFPSNLHINDLSSEFSGRQNIGRGVRRGTFQGDYLDSGRGFGNARISRPMEGLRHDAPERGFGFHASPRDLPFSPPRQFHRPFIGQHIDDPYVFDDNAHERKRPFSMIDPAPDYVEPIRHRPRLDYTDPEALFQRSHYQDAYRSGSSRYPHDYYDRDFGRGPYSSFYGGDQTYRGGYHY